MEPVPQSPELATVTRDEDMWILRVESNGKVHEYRCGSELQARALAILLLPGTEDRTAEPSPTLS